MRLADLLTLKRAGEDHFQAPATDSRSTRTFGGQVVAQALMAALETVPADRPAHSLHAHFLRPGDSGADIDFAVDRLLDGRSFSSRQVSAVQGGKRILTATVSCQKPEDGRLDHQFPMPSVPGPEGLRSEQEIRAEQQARTDVQWLGPLVLGHMRVELRPVWPRDFAKPEPRPAVQHFWARPYDPVPADLPMRQAVLAYTSDMMALSTGLLPHGIYWTTTAMQSASLDHALWFHREPRFDDWLLWTIEAPWTGANRTLVRGSFHDREGRLIATMAQEGLLRLR